MASPSPSSSPLTCVVWTDEAAARTFPCPNAPLGGGRQAKDVQCLLLPKLTSCMRDRKCQESVPDAERSVSSLCQHRAGMHLFDVGLKAHKCPQRFRQL